MRSGRVLALELTSKLCAFTVLEGPERLVVWGTRGLSADVSAFLPKLEREVLRYRPDVLVLEEVAGSRKGQRVREHLAWIEQWATDQDLTWSAIPKPEFDTWAEHLGETKEAKAGMIARLFPELHELVPPPRKTWQAQAERLNLFVALARGLCYYEMSERRS